MGVVAMVAVTSVRRYLTSVEKTTCEGTHMTTTDVTAQALLRQKERNSLGR